MFVADLSQYQPSQIDFTKMKAVLDFVILRDQHGYTIKDSHYDSYVAGCLAAGLPFNTYAFFGALDVSDALAEANADIARMSKRSQVAWIDIEQVTVKSGLDSDLWAAGNMYYDTLKKAGFSKVGLYSGEYFYNTHKLYNIKHDALWLAKYNTNDGKLNLSERPQVPCDLWQFTSVGSAGGITPLDLSVIVGTKTLEWFTGAQVEAAATSIASAPAVPDLFCMNNSIVANVQSVAGNDIRRAPSHNAAYVRNTKADEIFDCYEIKQNENDTWYAVGGANWICANGGKNATVIRTITPPAATMPTPAKAPSPAAQVTAPVTSQTNIVIPRLSGLHLGAVENYIKNFNWYMATSTDKGDTVTIETGIFDKTSHVYATFTSFLDALGVSYTEKAPA